MHRRHFALWICSGLFLAGCGGGGGSGSTTATSTQSSTSTAPTLAANATVTQPTASPSPVVVLSGTPTAPGQPLAGLDPGQLLRFQDGLAAFTKNEQAEPDFGPLFNGNSCVQCHRAPAPGGGGGTLVTRFGKTTGNVFDPLENEGGSLMQAFSLPGTPTERIPPDANVTARRRTTSVLGAGLVEAIPDSAIVDNAKLQLVQNPAQAGQLNFVTSPSDGAVHVGRFGWKSQVALLLDFSADAYANEMGVSSSVMPIENVANGPARTIPADQVEDKPDANGIRDIDRFTDFMRFLAPPPARASVPQGERTFNTIGCAVCHHPSFTTVSSLAALNNKTVFCYSDFLLHDVGTGDGIVQGSAPANKLRTAPLMGVSSQPTLLHDGSARTITAAILAHAGEAAPSQQAFQNLTPADRQSLLDFLNSI